jgi:predicted nucleotidyltransferase
MRSRSQNQLNRKYDVIARRAASIVKREQPDLVGILVHGSVARGEPGPHSDIDMVGVTGRRKKKPSEYSFFDGDVYVGVGFLSIAELEKEFKDPNKFFWARGSAEATRILYDPRGILRRIMLRWKKAKLSDQILQESLWDAYHNMIEYSGKLKNVMAAAGAITAKIPAPRMAASPVETASNMLSWGLRLVSDGSLKAPIPA